MIQISNRLLDKFMTSNNRNLELHSEHYSVIKRDANEVCRVDPNIMLA